MRRDAALALVLSLAALTVACGRSGSSAPYRCMQLQGQQLNATTGNCLGPPVALDGLNVCHDPAEAQGHGVWLVCVVSADGRLFKSGMSSTEWLEGAGWTHSAEPDEASTLSAADQARCTAALARPACP